jgi:diacylglycerol kinase family enzyme
MVRYRDKMEYASRLGKIRANIRAAIGVVFNPPVFDMEFTVDGKTEHRRVCAISASNNEFGQSPLLVADDITRGHLGLYIADALTPSGVTGLAVDILRGKLKENASVTAMAVPEAELHFPKSRHDVKCVMDGELLPMKRDVTLKIHAGELKVIVPKDFANL